MLVSDQSNSNRCKSTMVPPLHGYELGFCFGAGHNDDDSLQIELKLHSVSSAQILFCNFPTGLHSMLQHFPLLGLKNIFLIDVLKIGCLNHLPASSVGL